MSMNSSAEKGDFPDQREPYEYDTKYPKAAWKFIAAEAVYLAVVLLLGITLIALMIPPVGSGSQNWYFKLVISVFGQPAGASFHYVVIAKFGLIGGCLNDIKWLIHSVARGLWHRDRVLWRLFTPLNSALTAVFFALIIQSGIISLFDPSSFRSLELAAAFGILTGYFADGVMSVLTNLASVLFGTIRDRRGSRNEPKDGNKKT